VTTHRHHWVISDPYSHGSGPQVQDWACKCGATKTAQPTWQPPNQFFLARREEREL